MGAIRYERSRARRAAPPQSDPTKGRHPVTEFVAHYLTERYHQGIGSQIIKPRPSPSNDSASLDAIACQPRLGGLLNYYCREAA
jgi:hypothetical protein